MIRHCAHCTKEFEFDPAHPRKKYCDKRCKNAAWARKHRIEQAALMQQKTWRYKRQGILANTDRKTHEYKNP